MSESKHSSIRGEGRPLVAVIGAGAIGLSIAWRLAQGGATVDVFERGEAGRGATWAAAGMLAAGVEAEPGEERLLALTRHSQALWPAFARELGDETGIDVGYRDEGTLAVALNRDDAALLRFSFEFHRKLGIDLEWLDGARAREREPHLAPGVVAAVLSPRDHQVDNRQLALALRAAAIKRGASIHEHAEAAVEVSGGRALGVVVRDKLHRADVVIVAAGAWARGVAGLPERARPPVRPVKGQMVALRMDPATPLLRHVIWAPKGYLVPRRDGRLLIGATTEERGFDDTLTAGAVMGLIEAAWRVLPAVEELPIAEMWTGLRPGSRDDAPIMGPTAIDGLVLATGHHRNGILLTPASAEAIAGFVRDGALPEWAAPFTLARFARAPERKGA
jgi:glycine oxidase